MPIKLAARDKHYYDMYRRKFPPPPHLLQREIRPWLLDQAERWIKEHPTSDLVFAVRYHIVQMRRMGWGEC